MSYVIHVTLTSELTTTLKGHGLLKAYYHRLKMIEDTNCTRGGGSQTAHHFNLWLQKAENPAKDIIKKNGYNGL